MLLPLKNNFTLDVNGRRLTYLVTLLNDEPIPTGGKEHKQRGKSLVHRLYALGADVSLISEITSLSHETIFWDLAPCLAQATERAWGWVDGKRVSFDTGLPAKPPTPSIKERIIDATLRTELVEPDLKPAVRERAINTFNGFQGTPVKKLSWLLTTHTPN